MSSRPLKRTLTETTSVYIPKKTKVTNSSKWNKSAFGKLNSLYKSRLAYADAWTRSLPATGVYNFMYRGNAVRDVEMKNSTKLPIGMHEIQQLYRRYYVSASSIKVMAKYTVDPEIPKNIRILVWADSNALEAPTTPQAAIEVCARNRGINIPMDKYCSRDAYLRTTTYKQTGGSIKEADFTSLATSIPRNEWFWHVAIVNNGAADNGNFNVLLEYDTHWYQSSNVKADDE